MNTIQYAQAVPENVKDFYSQNDTVDFQIEFPGRALMLNKIRIVGDLEVHTTGSTPISSTNNYKIDPQIGIHSVIQQANVNFQKVGSIESSVEYPRYVKMITSASKHYNDMNSSEYVSELRSCDESISSRVILPRVPKTYGGANADGTIAQLPTGAGQKVNFSFKPYLCINRAVGNDTLSYQSSGAINISLILERNLGVLYGTDVDANSNYRLSNLRLCYMTVPDVEQPQKVIMRHSVLLKNSLQSAVSNISSKVPAVCDSVMISFLNKSHEYTANNNNTQLAQPPSISKVRYLFNDNFSQYITFEITDRIEMIERGIQAVKLSADSAMLSKLAVNESYLIGLDWNSMIDLSQTKFNINLSSAIDNVDNSYIMYSYFNSVISVN